jgi:hypothetical protein
MTHAVATAYAEAAARGQRFSGRRLPRAGHILAVTARPGQESADLGRLLYAFRQRAALAAHTSQAKARPRAQRCIDRQDDREQLRWLVPPRRDRTAYLLSV